MAFAQAKNVPGHDQPGRWPISERWVLGSHLLALDGAAKVVYPIRIAHASGNESPDFLVSQGPNGGMEGCEVTQATTRKYQESQKKFERSNAMVRDVAGGRGVAGYQAESYWCRRILRAVRSKLGKLKQGHYERARKQHLLIYDDMDMVAVDHREAFISWPRRAGGRTPACRSGRGLHLDRCRPYRP
jgi:hypothetical protein